MLLMKVFKETLELLEISSENTLSDSNIELLLWIEIFLFWTSSLLDGPLAILFVHMCVYLSVFEYL